MVWVPPTSHGRWGKRFLHASALHWWIERAALRCQHSAYTFNVLHPLLPPFISPYPLFRNGAAILDISRGGGNLRFHVHEAFSETLHGAIEHSIGQENMLQLKLSKKFIDKETKLKTVLSGDVKVPLSHTLSLAYILFLFSLHATTQS